MIAIVPVAGKSRRFYEAGYKIPKIFLPVEGGKFMLERVIESLGLSSDDTLYIVGDVNNSDVYDTIHSRLAKVRGVAWSTAWIENPIDPLNTVARVASKFFDSHDPLLINFGDVWMTEGAQALINVVKGSAPCGMTIFNADGDRFDHIMPGVAMGGTFYFQDAEQFFEKARELVKQKSAKERGPKDVVMALSGHTFYRTTLQENYIDLGIPADYESHLRAAYPETWEQILSEVRKVKQ